MIDELIETNNENGLNVTVTDLCNPDLIISAISVAGPGPYAGTNTTIDVTVENIGARDAMNCELTLWIGGISLRGNA